MNFSDVEELFSVGSKVRLKLTSQAETVEGTIMKLNAPSIILRRADTGKPKIIDCEIVKDIDFVDDNEPTATITQPTAPVIPVILPQPNKKILSTPLIYFTQPAPIQFVHREDIKSRIKEYRDSGELRGFDKDWNQLDNSFENAKKNKSLFEKKEQILRQLKDLVKNYPSEPVNIFAGDVYSAYKDWGRAALAYSKARLYPEAVACAMNVADTKNFLIEVLRKQILNKDERTTEALRLFFYHAAEIHCHRLGGELVEKISSELTNVEREIVCQGCYKILVDSGNATSLNWDDFDYSPYGLQQLVETLKSVGQKDPPLHLPEFDGERSTPSAAVRRGKVTFYKQSERYGFIDGKIFFYLAQVEDKGLRAALNQFGSWRDNIRITYILAEGKTGVAADHINLVAGETLPPESADIHNGVLDFYNNELDFGKVIDIHNGQSYAFKLDTVQDICLRRHFKDNFTFSELHVQFTLKLHRDKTVVQRLRLTRNELIKLSNQYGLATPEEQPPLTTDVSKNLPAYQPLPPLRSKRFKPPSSTYFGYRNNAYEEDCLPLSAYAKYVLEQINLKTYFTAYHRIFKKKFDIFASKFDGDDFLGTPEEATEIRIEIIKNLTNFGDKERSEAWAFVLKLSSKVYSRFSKDLDRCDKNRIGPHWEHEYAAQFMGYAGDYELQKQLDCKVDVARFFYNEEMTMTPKGSKIDTRAYLVKLLASFFIEPNAVSHLKTSSTPPLDKDMNVHLAYLKNNRESSEPQRLLVNTFLITEKMSEGTSEFLKEMAKSPRWLLEAEKLFNQLMPEQACTLTESNFKSCWQKAKGAYLKSIEKFLKVLRTAVENYDNTDEAGLDSFLKKINAMLESNLLSDTDKERIEGYRELLLIMSKIADKNNFENKEKKYKEVIEKSDDLMEDIRKKPTKLSYETLQEAVENLHFKAENELKKLYESSVPDLKIETNIIGAGPEFIVTVENKENCQTADNMKIEVTGIDGEVKFRERNKKTGSVFNEFLYEADLGDKEKSQGYFEVTVRVTYRYRVAINETTENSIERNDNISLLNSEDYEEIVNVYHKIAETNGVPIGSNLFYGRDEDINKIVQMLKLPDGSLLKHRCLVMHGQKRAGKTSIMNHLKQKIRDAYGQEAYVIVSMGSVGEWQSMYGFLAGMIYKLEETLRKEHRKLYDYLRENEVIFPYGEIETNSFDDAKNGIFNRTLDKIIAKSSEFGGSVDKYIPLFLIDEFTYFYQWIKDRSLSSNFMKFWKAFLQNNPVCSIVIGMDHMPQFIAEYENEFACSREIPVHFLKEIDTKDLAEKPILLKDGTSRYRDKPGEDALSYVYKLTAGSAYLTVIFCDAFVDYLNERRTTYITRTVIDNFIKERLLGSRPVLKEIMFDPQLNDPGKFSPEEQNNTYADNKALLTYIAVHADKLNHELSREKIECISELSEKTSERRDIILDRLVKRRVLNLRDSNYYKIEIELLRMWLRREVGEDF